MSNYNALDRKTDAEDAENFEYERNQVVLSAERNGQFWVGRSSLSEKELADTTCSQLSTLFLIEREVRGTSWTGKKLRLDAVMRPRDPSGWWDKDPVFGVEFKRLHKWESFSKYTRWAAQSEDYAHATWDGYGSLTIFTCPPVTSGSPYLGLDGGVLRFAWSRILGQHDVGEFGIVAEPWLGWVLRLSGENIWTESRGWNRGEYGRRSLIPKEGSSR